MTAALYFVVVDDDRKQCPTLDDAYDLAWSLLQSGAPVVDIIQRKLIADCWTVSIESLGKDGLLHHLAPGEYPIAPTGGHGSTGTFPPYVWRMLHDEPPAALAEAFTNPVLGEPWPDEPAAPPRPVVIEELQGTLFG